MKFPAVIGNYDTLVKGDMNLPIKIDNRNKKHVQKNICNFDNKPLELTLVNKKTGEIESVYCKIKKRGKKKSFYKIIFYVEEKEAKLFEPELYKFDEQELEVKLEVDADKREKELNQISHDQRKKIYAILNDIDDATGQGVESLKKQLKFKAASDPEYENITDMFSLSDCEKETASDFIEFLIDFAFQHGFEIKSQEPREFFDDIERYIYVCLKNKICCICGKKYSDDPHHVDTIGMGNDRQELNDDEKLKLPLCYEEHHPEIHTIGDESFCEKYHVKPIKFKE